MSNTEKELWQAFMQWLEIAKETDELLRAVRQELDQIKQTQG